MNIESITDQALTSREELKKLEHFSRLAENNLQLNRADRYPEIFAVVDYGFQGDAYRFTGEDDFVMASVILKWDLFKGLQERSEIAEARIMEEKVAFQQEEARKKIRLEVINNWHELYSSVKKLEASQANAETASEVFRIVNKRYSQNQASLLEFLDARNNMTRARQNMIINTWDTMIRYAALEKAAGFYDLDPEP